MTSETRLRCHEMNAIDFFDFIEKRESLRSQTWLVVGKGPSFSALDDEASSGYVKIGINHVCESVDVEFLHVMDLDVIDNLGGLIDKRAKFLVVPRYPHVAYTLPGLRGTFHKPGTRSIDDLVGSHAVLGLLASQGRLLCYAASTGTRTRQNAKAVKVGPFSAATVVELLGLAGVKRIRTIGVDGGVAYATEFRHLADKTRLDSGQSSYDLQFEAIARAIRTYDLEFGAIGMQLPVQIYVGTQAEQEVATRVLEYSIRRHASVSVNVVPLHLAISQAIPAYEEIVAGLAQGTPFSLQRFAIPELMGRQGRAIYLDSDMQVFGDIRELWSWPIGDGPAAAVQPTPGGRAPQLSVLVIDCERAKWDVREIAARLRADPAAYSEVFGGQGYVGDIERTIPYCWNSLELYEKNVTRLVHYTNMRHQPWLSWRNPLAEIWCADLIEAVDTGCMPIEVVEDHVARGWMRPSLLTQLRQRQADPMLVGIKQLLREERMFLPPHMQPRQDWLRHAAGFGELDLSPAQSSVRWLLSHCRYFMQRSGVTPLLRGSYMVIGKVVRAVRAGR